jgi:tetratricopeptide (TPR) repeat protein
LEEAEKALRLSSNLDREEELYLWTRFVGAVSCLNMNESDKAERICLNAIMISPMHIDSHYLLSSIYYSQGIIKAFMDHSDKYLSLVDDVRNDPGKFGAMVHNTIGHEWRIHLHRGFAFMDLGKDKESDQEYALALDMCSNKDEYYKQRCLIHLNRSEYGKAEQFCRKALRYNPEDRELAGLRKRLLKEKGAKKKGRINKKTRKGNNRPTISLCMIVKNEEKSLPQCLESIKDVVDEIIIVDTGSTDGTILISENYTDNIYLHSWEENFSKHRNQSISYATGDWIFILDADEILLPECGKGVREAVLDDSIDSIYVTVNSSYDQSRGEAVHNSIRIFRNNGKIHYEGRVHNRVVGQKASKIYPITILHEGYNLTPEESRKKFLRTTTLLNREIEENPEHPMAYHYLASSYLSEEMYDKAIVSAMKAVELSEKNKFNDYIYLWSHFIAGLSYIKTERLDEAEEICLKAINQCSRHLDSHYLLTVVYTNKKRWDKVIHHSGQYGNLLERIEKSPGEFGPMVHNTVNHRWRIHLYRGFAFYKKNEREEAKSEFKQAFNICDTPSEYFKLLALFYMENSEFEDAERYLFKALNEGHEGKRDTKQSKEKPLEPDSDNIETLFSLANLYLKENRFDASIGLYEKIVESNKSHAGALINMGNALRRIGEPLKAITYLGEAVKISPLSIEANSNLAYAYYESQNFKSAREIFQKICQIDNNFEDVHLHLAIIDLKGMDIESCVFECDQVLRILGMARDEVLNGLPDLAKKFIEIGEHLEALQKIQLTSLACSIANELLEIASGNRKAIPA